MVPPSLSFCLDILHFELFTGLYKMQNMELESTAVKSADAVIKRAVQRGLTADRTKIDPCVVRRNLRPKSTKDYSRVFEVWYL
jgi:hypothetical protein